MQFWSTILILALLTGLVACAPRDAGDGAAQEPPGLENGSFTAELNGFNIHYEVHGSGPVLMALTNSWGFDAAGLRAVLAPLEQRLTMVYFDPRGMGESDPIREETDMGLAAVRADFDALRRHLGLSRVHAIGWSNGAMNLVLLASEHPETIESAIFMHGAASFTAEDMQAYFERYPELMQAFGAFQQEMQNPALSDDEKTARMHQVWVEQFFPASSADPERMLPIFRETFRVESFDWKHSEYTNRATPEFDARDQLSAITARSLVITGPHDMMPASKAEELRDGIAGATLVVFDNSGHFASLEEPERFQQVVFEFLAVQ